jgi:hypothetical protein
VTEIKLKNDCGVALLAFRTKNLKRAKSIFQVMAKPFFIKQRPQNFL